MTYSTCIIPDKAAIHTCPQFRVGHFLWTNRRRPETTGRMGYIPGQGLFVRMASGEDAPRCTYKNHMDMVCLDSAMEAFFAFPAQHLARREGFAPQDGELYFNFEVNPLGAMYAKYGRSRQQREQLSEAEFAATGVAAGITGEGWWMEFLLPEDLLLRVTGKDGLEEGDVFFCNFYKISETPEIEHYAAWANIPTDTPDFHQPRYFGAARITACHE